MSLERIAGMLSRLCESAATLAKVAVRSRRPSPGVRRDASSEVVILGNGPGLRDAIDNHMEFLMGRERMAVNFAANAPEFRVLVPSFYVLADPHFFDGGNDANVDLLWRNLRSVEHDMTLYVPCVRYKQACEAVRPSARVRVKTFNLTPSEGCDCLSHILYDAGLAMPRPRNVLIPSIMTAMREGFKTIYIAGADHTWSRTLGVDEHNRVVSVQPHFYKDSDSEQKRVNTEYEGYHLHDILYSLYVAFRSYHKIEAYAVCRGVRIINITPGSMIDAFCRKSLVSL